MTFDGEGFHRDAMTSENRMTFEKKIMTFDEPGPINKSLI